MKNNSTKPHKKGAEAYRARLRAEDVVMETGFDLCQTRPELRREVVEARRQALARCEDGE